VASSRPAKRSLGGTCTSQELHELIIDQVGSFVLYPVPDVVEFESSHTPEAQPASDLRLADKVLLAHLPFPK
jgi:hypothetical protein